MAAKREPIPQVKAPTTSPNDGAIWVERLLKILGSEQELGFANTAVMGGMDGFTSHWSQEIITQTSNVRLARRLLGASYRDMSPEQRARWAAEWLKLLSAEGKVPQAENIKRPARGVPAARKATTTETAPDGPPDAPPDGLADDPEGSQAETRPSRKTARRAATPGSLSVDEPVDRLRGVDTKLSARLKRLDVATVRDLLYLFPRRHTDYSNATKIADLTPGAECTVVATVWEARQVSRGPQGKRQDCEAVLNDETGNVRVAWFGQRYLAQTLKPNARIAISGKATVFNGQLVFQSPEYELLDSVQAAIHTGRMVPVYPLTEGLTGRSLRRIIWQALQDWLEGIEEVLPRQILDRAKLMPLKQAIAQAHYPDSEASWAEARRRLAFDELLTLQVAVLSRKHRQSLESGGIRVQPKPQVLKGFLDSLPFEITDAQRRSIGEIARDLEQGSRPMNRLLQGEVGSGKTVVALAALLMVAADGYQGALMVPTEVLAEQHFQTVVRLLGGLASPVNEENQITVYLESLSRPVSAGLITGSTKAARKRELTRMAADGNLDILIGTQALIQQSVSMPKLALAVADEQHRFGVLQRSALRQRTDETPHVLLMSATPIPRTLSLTLYGDLEISTLDQLPAGRLEIATRWLPPERREAAHGFVRQQVQAGRQGFVICPLVDESESIETKAATEEYRRLSEEVFPDLRVGLLHGRMTPKNKDQIMREFRDGNLDLLVSTPVVEVGIDVANATVMMIEGADRFGLAQLHQFRGRVGRGSHKSYCLLLSDSPSESAKERLSALERIHDGFKLAETDLELRGPGDFFGTRQSGLPNLRMAQLSDRHLLETAREEANRIIEEDPDLSNEENAPLAGQVGRFLAWVTDDTA